jgi:hypothetical protein
VGDFIESAVQVKTGYGLTGVQAVVAGAVDFDKGDLHGLIMPDADVTLTFSNAGQRIGTFRLLVQHNANSHTLTFPTVFYAGVGSAAQVVTLAAGASAWEQFDITFDGVAYFVRPTAYHA